MFEKLYLLTGPFCEESSALGHVRNLTLRTLHKHNMKVNHLYFLEMVSYITHNPLLWRVRNSSCRVVFVYSCKIFFFDWLTEWGCKNVIVISYLPTRCHIDYRQVEYYYRLQRLKVTFEFLPGWRVCIVTFRSDRLLIILILDI